MDRILVRNFLIFTALALFCFGGLGIALKNSNRAIETSDSWVVHSNLTISGTERLAMLTEGMINSQRGFLISNNTSFLKEYEVRKQAMSQQLADLSELMRDNPSQQSRLDEIRGYFTGLSFNLEERARKFAKPAVNRDLMQGIETIDSFRKNILRLHDDVIKEEQDLLKQRVKTVEKLKNQYFTTLILGGILCIVVMMLLNCFLLLSQRKRNKAERNLRESEDRFILAANGANDGIFDWNIQTDMVYCSKAYFSMLGIDKPASAIPAAELKKLVHPGDADAAQLHSTQYLRGELSEYSNVFRMRHSSGRWVWISSRAKAMYDEEGRPFRMVGAHIDVTALKVQQERLEEARIAAENANRAKTDFLAHMSHEIRTPLTAISGIAEILEKQKSTLNDKQKQLVHTLTSSTTSLRDLIDDILDFSKIESGEIEIDMKDFAPAEIFERVISIISVSAHNRGLLFEFDYSALRNKKIKGDPHRIRQILINLVGNAVKFTEKGSVSVVATYDTDHSGHEMMKIEVTDTGIGIDPAAMDVIFERFKQGDASVSRKYGGTGLGLPISRNLARIMGGDITVKSIKGQGSCFTVTLPIEMTMDASTGMPNLRRITRAPSQPRTKDKGENKKPAVLMVEDYEGNIIVVGHILEEMGLDFDVARTGKQALDLWREKPYDLILMDIQMPEMDGFTATREIREEEIAKDLMPIPIIGMTAHALVGDRNKCIEAGMDAYLAKPIVDADMRTAIAQYLPQESIAA